MAIQEVAGLPEGGPADLARCVAQVGNGRPLPEADSDRLALIVDAVNSLVRTWRVAEDSADADVDVEERTWRASTVEGCTLLVARLYRRKNSPDGVAAFTDLGPVYVQRNDPDVAMYLGLGTWAAPMVG